MAVLVATRWTSVAVATAARRFASPTPGANANEVCRCRVLLRYRQTQILASADLAARIPSEESSMTAGLIGVTEKLALQQPAWDDLGEARRIKEQLAARAYPSFP